MTQSTSDFFGRLEVSPTVLHAQTGLISYLLLHYYGAGNAEQQAGLARLIALLCAAADALTLLHHYLG